MKIFAAREEDAHQGWVWLEEALLPARSVIKISNPQNKKSVYCEAMQIDKNFRDQYNQARRYEIENASNALVIGAWYRSGLGILETQIDVELEVSACNSCWGKFKACTGHPQVVVRLAAKLGGISLALGIVGLILGIAGLIVGLMGV